MKAKRGTRREATTLDMEGQRFTEVTAAAAQDSVTDPTTLAAGQFDEASLQTRLFMCLGRTVQAKKTCALILLLILLLVVQLTQLFVLPGSAAGQQTSLSDRSLQQLVSHVFPADFRPATAHLPVAWVNASAAAAASAAAPLDD